MLKPIPEWEAFRIITQTHSPPTLNTAHQKRYSALSLRLRPGWLNPLP